jgi:peptidoglycan/xylan/chitin deacetylase (PgdA/CDA1 family)
MQLALKIDVDTFRGTREGVPRLAQLLERLHAPATFLFSLGPDHTGRAIRRAFRPGFLSKVQRTSVVSHYGIRTLLYGTLLPGPHIGRRCREVLRSIAARGFEVGVHCYDHVEWQDRVAGESVAWTRAELGKAYEAFQEAYDRPPQLHGAAGWQINQSALEAERELGFVCASDTRGECAFLPVADGEVIGVPQLPTTLPTLDELIGRRDIEPRDPVEHLLELVRASGGRPHVYTLHAELEGGRYLDAFERLLSGWRARGYEFATLGTMHAGLDSARLPKCSVIEGSVPGRAGTLACQGPVMELSSRGDCFAGQGPMRAP